MIVVDSSVWIAHLRNTDSVSVGKLRHLDDTQEILVGDLILLEMLQGARNEPHAQLIERNLRQFAFVPMLDPATAVESKLPETTACSSSGASLSARQSI